MAAHEDGTSDGRRDGKLYGRRNGTSDGGRDGGTSDDGRDGTSDDQRDGGTSDSRWHRLERYCRWRRCLRWSLLPDDVVTLVASYLTEEEVLSLGAAFLAADQDPALVPAAFRGLWMRCSMSRAFKQFVLREASEEALWHAKECHSFQFVVDWSCFSPSPPRPVVEIGWVGKRPQVIFDEWALWRAILHHARHDLPVCRITAHARFAFAHSHVMHPAPSFAKAFTLIPPTFLPHFSAATRGYAGEFHSS